MFLTNLAVSENNLDTRPIGERFANELSNIEGGNSEESNAPIGEIKLDNEKKREHAEEDTSQSIGDRIGKRLEELGISQDDISSLPVLSRFQSKSSLTLSFPVIMLVVSSQDSHQGNPGLKVPQCDRGCDHL